MPVMVLDHIGFSPSLPWAAISPVWWYLLVKALGGPVRYIII